MALKVWLPLNGNLENKGISNPVIGLVGTPTIKTNGKIGQCYTMNGSNGISIAQQILPSQTPAWSFACWFSLANTTSTAAACLFSERTGGNSNGYTIFIYPNNSNMLIDDGTRWTVKPMTFVANTWYHLVVTRDSTGKKIYINGELKSSTTVVGNTSAVNANGCLIGLAQSSTALTTGNQGLIGDINDVRIYDHCLSPLEVKEISQGLVLHYKLDGFSGGAGENLAFAPTTATNFGSSNELRTITFSGWDAYAPLNLNLTTAEWNAMVGQKITYSCWMENIEQTAGTGTGIMLHIRYADGTYQQYGGGKNGTSGSYLTQGESGWLKLTITIPDPAIRTNPTTISHVQFSIRHNSSSGASTVQYQYAKVEKGDQQTAWSPAPSEIGIDTTKIKDSSGYENNGILTGNLETQPSDRYKIGFYNTSGVNNRITTPSLTFNSDAVTLNIWFKSSNTAPTGNYHMIVDSNVNRQWYEMCVYKDGYFRGGLFVNGTRYADNGTSTSILNGNWHMLTITYDGNIIKRYVDGVMEKSTTIAKTTGLSSPTAITLFRDGPNATYACKEASLSDFRIYATALSTEDVVTLYHTSAQIDNLGSVHGFEITEDVLNKELLALPWTSTYSTHNKTSISTNYNDKHEWYSNTNSSAGSDYIKINPTGKTYYYDTEISVAAGNQFYIGFERYDANKTSRSNQACVYIVAIKPSSAINHQRYSGTINLATDGVNPTDTIALRILNAWSGTDSNSTKEATIHYLSLREVNGNPQTGKIKQQGQIYTDEFVERNKQASIYQNGFVGGNTFIEK